jgi:thioredoxin reductase/bacterioferritin-associated ferredoxin
MSRDHDVIVLGAGPAGANAAMVAAESGLRVVLLDEHSAAGGQVYRRLPAHFRVPESVDLGADHHEGERLRGALEGTTVRTLFDRRVWFIAPGFRVQAATPAGPELHTARALIVAAGTHERLMPFPGWTTPGVIGLAAATILLKSQQMLPGRRTVVAGAGPLLAAVAAGIVKGGGELAAVVDVNGPGHWLTALPQIAGRLDLIRRGLGWIAAIQRSGAPILARHAVCTAEGDGALTAVRVRPVDGDGRPTGGERRIEADTLAMGYGLVPATEATRLLGADHDYQPHLGGWVPRTDNEGRSSVEGLYVAGDGAGVAGAAAAALGGRLAGLAVARDLGRLGPQAHERVAGRLRRRQATARRFGLAMGRLMAPKPGLIDLSAPGTLVCRCEDVSRGEIEAALGDGAVDLNQLKSWTRCGMGPCQGRICGEAAAILAARALGSREQAGAWTARTPLRPVPMEWLVGDFDYADIPKPAPAPG